VDYGPATTVQVTEESLGVGLGSLPGSVMPPAGIKKKKGSNQMRRVVGVLTVVMFLFISTGCAAGFIEYQERTYAPNIHSTTKTQYAPKSYQVLGLVEAEGEATSLLGMVVEGNNGQGLLWDAAKEKYGNRVTGLKDVTSKSEFRAMLPIILNEITTTYYGIAVQER
jgi:hypothetical protein